MVIDAPPTSPDMTKPLDLSALPFEYSEALAPLLRSVEKLTQRDPRELDGHQAAVVASALALVTGRLGVFGARALPAIEADGLWAEDGGKSFARWVATTYGWSMRTAQAQIRLGRALRDELPVTAQAATAGSVPPESAQIIAALAPTTELRRQALADPENECNESFLVEQAEALPVDRFRSLTRSWSAAMDPDADDRGYVEATDREFLVLDRTSDGFDLTGFLTTEHGQALRAALHAITPVPAAGDDRTSDQRRGQALGDLARVVLDHGLVGTGRAVRPRIEVLVPYAVLCAVADADAVNLTRDVSAQSGLGDVPARTATPLPTTTTVSAAALTGKGPIPSGAQFHDGTPVPRALLDRLACDSEITRYVFGPQSEILDVGRAERTFTGPRRTAIIARDKHCRYPGCHAPPALCEGHHVEHWARDHGSTSVDNGILLCWHHHELVHKKRIEIHRTGPRWVFRDARGREIGEASPRNEKSRTITSDVVERAETGSQGSGTVRAIGPRR